MSQTGNERSEQFYFKKLIQKIVLNNLFVSTDNIQFFLCA